MVSIRRLLGLLVLACAATAVVAQEVPKTGDVNGDGSVDRLDIELIVAARNTPASGPDDQRDINTDLLINAVDVRLATQRCSRPGCALPPAGITVDHSPAELTLLPGQSANIATSIAYTTSDASLRSVSVSQVVEPGNGGITLLQGIDSFSANAAITHLTNQTVVANQLGTYTIRTTAVLSDPPRVREEAVVVHVVPSLTQASLSAPAAYPGALAPSATTEVLFSVVALGFDPALGAPDVTLEGVGFPFAASLNDAGTGDDLVAGDGVYTARAFIDASARSVGECLALRARSANTVSENTSLCVSALPQGPAESDTSSPFTDPRSGVAVIRDEVLIYFVPGTSETQMVGLVSALPGTITGSFPQLGLVQVKLHTAPQTVDALLALVDSVQASPLVASASVHALGTTSAVTPNDGQFAQQWALTKVRADEAWVIARGGPLIAVLDTGVDAAHPDLAGKVVNFAFDFGDLDFNPADVNSHGTHVAGIAAARSNNGIGVAGAAWNSNVLNVKIFPDRGGGSDAKLIAGVTAAVASGARVLNLSVQGFGTATCPAIALAATLQRVVVVAAGNSGHSTIDYPAGCPGALSVGNTTSTDGRASSSNFGSWVQIAAPGTDILSTLPGGAYGLLSGTSMASPLVAGAAAVVLSRAPGLSAVQVVERLKKTAKPLPSGLQLGAGRLDLFEAVFGGGFEDPDLPSWTRTGTAASIAALGPLAPQDGSKRMLFVSTGPAGDQVSGQVSQSFTVQPGVTSIPIRFRYTFVSEEYPEFVGTVFNDALRITLLAPNGTQTVLASVSVNSAAFAPISGINFPGGDSTVGWTGWSNVFVTVPVTAGPGTYRIFVTDAGDDIYDTATLVDGIAFK